MKGFVPRAPLQNLLKPNCGLEYRRSYSLTDLLEWRLRLRAPLLSIWIGRFISDLIWQVLLAPPVKINGKRAREARLLPSLQRTDGLPRPLS